LAYCTVDDVQSELRQLTLSDTSKPTVTEVEGWCDETAAEMDAVFGALGVELPISDMSRLGVVRSWAVLGVCARVLRSVEMENAHAKWFQDMYDNKLKLVQSWPAILGIPGTTEGPAPKMYTPSSTDRPFNREEQDW
jgi:hypothetical protein